MLEIDVHPPVVIESGPQTGEGVCIPKVDHANPSPVVRNITRLDDVNVGIELVIDNAFCLNPQTLNESIMLHAGQQGEVVLILSGVISVVRSLRVVDCEFLAAFLGARGNDDVLIDPVRWPVWVRG